MKKPKIVKVVKKVEAVKPAPKPEPIPAPVIAPAPEPDDWPVLAPEPKVEAKPEPVVIASSALSGPPRCAKCDKIEGNHFFKTRHCAPHRDDVYEAPK